MQNGRGRSSCRDSHNLQERRHLFHACEGYLDERARPLPLLLGVSEQSRERWGRTLRMHAGQEDFNHEREKKRIMALLVAAAFMHALEVI